MDVNSSSDPEDGAPRRFSAAALRAAGRAACVTMAAVLATLACVHALSPSPGAAVLAVFLPLALARSHGHATLRQRIKAGLALPFIGLAALGAGWLLLHRPWPGAALFVGALSLPIWARRFGPGTARLAALAGLPFIALLVTPHDAAPAAGPVPPMLMPLVAGLCAVFWVALCQGLARRFGWMDTAPVRPARRVAHGESAGSGPAPRGAAGGLRPAPNTRLAVQMALALALAFAIGYALFAERWAWIVLTAYLVSSGNRGRLDVAYKGVLRMAGALGGTAIALVLQSHAGAAGIGDGSGTVALILAALFMGCWLRPFGYGWWALCVTVAFALLQGMEGGPPGRFLWLRMEEIVLGAVIAVGVAWLVLPLRSTQVLRRRMADALAALGDALDPASPAPSMAAFAVSLQGVGELAPAFRAASMFGGRRAEPARWIALLEACGRAACVLPAEGAPPEVRRAVGAARKALRDPDQLTPALLHLHRTLATQPSAR